MIRDVSSGGLVAAPPRALPVPPLGFLEARLSRRVRLALAYLVALAPALAVAFMQPVWQLTDEAQHFDVLAQYAHGVFPVEGVTTLRPETVAVMVATGNYRWSPPETQPRPAIVNPAQFGPPPRYLSGYGFQLWVRRHIWWFSYEAMQPPLFYVAATPVWMVADRIWGGFGAVFAVRALNALVLALAAPLALTAAGLLLPGRRWAGAAAVIVTAAMPGLLLNGSQVTNDTSGAVLGSATVVAAAIMARRGWTPRWAALLGLLFGLTLLAKLTAAGLVVGIAAAWAWPMWQLGARLSRQLKLGAIAAAAAAAALVPWLVVNTVVYGHPVPTAEAARLLGAGTSGARFTFAQSVNYCFQTFWTGEHKDTLPYTGAFVWLMLVLTVLAAVGVQRLVRRTAWLRSEPATLAVMLAAFLGQTAWALSIPTTSGLGGMTPGRYLYPAIAPAMALFVAGLFAVGRRFQLQVLLVTAFAALSLVNFAAYSTGRTAIPHEERSGPPTTVAVQDEDGSGYYEGVTVAVDRMVTDHRAGSVWAHIHVRNDRPLPADWWPGPSVRVSNGVHVSADYAASTPFPETLAPGGDYWGWIRLGLPPSSVPPGSTLTLVFEDIAANQYRDVGKLKVAVQMPVEADALPGSGSSRP